MNCASLALALTLTFSAAAYAVPSGNLPVFLPEAAEEAAAEPAAPAVPAPAGFIQPCRSDTGAVTYEARLPVLMYHHVVPDGEACNEMTVTAGRLEEDLRWLAENGYHTVLPRELAAGQPLPEKSVLLTFDDGYRSNYLLAYPLLQKYQVKAAVALMAYMPDSRSDGFLSWDMCREMTASGLVEIGSHGYAIHNLDERMGDFVPGQANGVQRRKGESDGDFKTRVLNDLMRSYTRIAMEIGVPPAFFSYPFGKTDPDADAFLESLFPVTAVTGSGKRDADLSKGLQKLPRFTITMKAGPEAFLSRG